ncbi:MAG: RNA polymerase sigma factor [Planctomycetes bacterium]|nr:RNA polymerase sigma factor [Planctomycetota bacterium]
MAPTPTATAQDAHSSNGASPHRIARNGASLEDETSNADDASDNLPGEHSARSETTQPAIEPGSAEHRAWVLALLDQHEARLTRYAQRLTRDLNSARDVVQHAFVALCAEPPQKIRQPAAWLYTACYRRALDVLRQAERTILQAHFGTDEDADQPNVTSREPDPSALCEQRDTSELLRRIVDQLPDNQRQVILLWCEGFRYREISQITGHGESYVRVLAQRALNEIRQDPRCAALRDEQPSDQ